ncbi:MAG TPA: adenylate/guanylate cyclase domain-containing protein [Leptospiraceae bacterium]|nr:adenylate/guanylate cyclase domain-containing protein [Leptospiraceae bacterium]HMW03650.1 adenylate/guanylate cyclase domain-containing protein [Leptospiraceae bacterium]HMX31223.1 adenylate/guanylate cyclase domain-containing protein [Leptospiraceae bacterium]HMY29429.1 adenylate/guanylate cyclase domain-containing protein [Leptospiraceae bacterium]HMZ65839.1 adenylate/guanylate cyclase domain-containing protein [Leptospiraceae bacterium]
MEDIRHIIRSRSEERLRNLIEERLKPGANKELIDKKIWNLFGENWAIIFTDLSGFSRNTAEFGIIHFLQIIFESERILLPIIYEHNGLLIKAEGDSLMLIFRTVVDAVECSVKMQRTLKEYNENKLEHEKVLLCVGIGYGKILRIGDADIFGEEVNAASKLGEDTAKRGEILLTKSAVAELGIQSSYVFHPASEKEDWVEAYKLEY